MDKPRVIYLSSFTYPSTHAHPLHALLMARGFTKLLGEKFLFVTGKADQSVLQGIPYRTLFAGIHPILRFLRLRSIAYAGWLLVFLLCHPSSRHNLTVFTNDLKLAAAVGYVRALFTFTLIVEVHSSAVRTVTRRADRLVFVTESLRKEFIDCYPEFAERSTVHRNAVEAAEFSRDDQFGKVRKRLSISNDAAVIGYIGRFQPMESDKGVSFLVNVMTTLPGGVVLLLVGGTREEVRETERLVKERNLEARIRVVGYVPHKEIPEYMSAADILTYVPPKGDAFLAHETSPMKLFEYQAAQRPIIASDLPAFREALGPDTAYLITPGSEEEFLRAVTAIRTNPDDSAEKVARGYERVREDSWENRARRILFP